MPNLINLLLADNIVQPSNTGDNTFVPALKDSATISLLMSYIRSRYYDPTVYVKNFDNPPSQVDYFVESIMPGHATRGKITNNVRPYLPIASGDYMAERSNNGKFCTLLCWNYTAYSDDYKHNMYLVFFEDSNYHIYPISEHLTAEAGANTTITSYSVVQHGDIITVGARITVNGDVTSSDALIVLPDKKYALTKNAALPIGHSGTTGVYFYYGNYNVTNTTRLYAYPDGTISSGDVFIFGSIV